MESPGPVYRFKLRLGIPDLPGVIWIPAPFKNEERDSVGLTDRQMDRSDGMNRWTNRQTDKQRYNQV